MSGINLIVKRLSLKSGIQLPVSSKTKSVVFYAQDELRRRERLQSMISDRYLFESSLSSGKLTRIAHSKIKGCNVVALIYQSMKRVYNIKSTIYKCPLFILHYYPPEHFLAVLRKSKPGIVIKFSGGLFLNGNIGVEYEDKPDFKKLCNEKRLMLSRIYKKTNSMIPRDYVYAKKMAKSIITHQFLDTWMKLRGHHSIDLINPLSSSAYETSLDTLGRTLPGLAKDGLYVYTTLLLPDRLSLKQYEHHIVKSVQKVADLDWDNFLKPSNPKSIFNSWVEEDNSKINLQGFKELSLSSQIPYYFERRKA